MEIVENSPATLRRNAIPDGVLNQIVEVIFVFVLYFWVPKRDASSFKHLDNLPVRVHGIAV